MRPLPASSPWLSSLPAALAERTRRVGPERCCAAGDFVLYWMHSAVRAHENPALDVALCLARETGRSLLVYQGLSERYPYASLRLHTFAVEGAIDVAAELSARQIPYAFHLERRGHREPALLALAKRAGVVVTDDVPTPFLRRWTARIAEAVPAPVLVVDASCTLPMALVERPPTRAFAYRDATASGRAARLAGPYEEQAVPDGLVPPDLPFVPLDLGASAGQMASELSDALAACDIDQGLPPVAHTRGGARAGYARWQAFVADGLDRYAERRNDPLALGGVSRMSAYLHFGHVSPFRLARQALARRGEGARKFVDELCIWRELAWSFCDHAWGPGVSPLEVLPAWARETLARHQDDPRPARRPLEALARGRSGDALWDAAQHSLLRHGELHNNVRMTWAKALPLWTASPAEAARMLFDLNDRLALDGRDPSSVGGLLWALGLFDRPFPEEKPILGTLRDRPLHAHARRLDVPRYAEQTTRPLWRPRKVAVVGAGIAGVSCARALHDQGVEVCLFDKGFGVGGRVATRQLVAEGVSFDLGAQYFTARHPLFRSFVEGWLDEGIVARWEGRIGALEAGGSIEEKQGTERYVALPGMRHLAIHLAKELDVRQAVRVQGVERRGDAWLLRCARGEETWVEGPYDALLVTLPPEQARGLLEAHSPRFLPRLQALRSGPVHAVGLAFDAPLPLSFDGLFLPGPTLAWAARDSSKPGRTRSPRFPERWVLHAAEDFTRAHLDATPEQVAEQLLEALWEHTEVAAAGRRPPVLVTHQRWLLARATSPLHEGALHEGTLWDDELCLGVGGDWCQGTRVEGAFLSGRSLAGSLFRQWHAKG